MNIQKSRDELHKYWKNPDEDSVPEKFFLQGEKISNFLVEEIKHYGINKNSRILEIGCNVGKNLNALFMAGYTNLHAIEINRDALELMKQKYPEMAKIVTTHNYAVENKIKDFKDKEFDVVFSVTVLQHIHKESEWIFNEMSRITRDYLFTIENEDEVARTTFRRNYKKVFENIGMKEIESINCMDRINVAYYARIFKHNR